MDNITDDNDVQIMNVGQAAKFMKCAASTVYRDCARGTMPCIRKGKRLLFKRDDLLSWLETMRTDPA